VVKILDVSVQDDSDIPQIVAFREHAKTLADDQERASFYLSLIVCAAAGLVNTLGRGMAIEIAHSTLRAALSWVKSDDPTKDDCDCEVCRARRLQKQSMN
jgi:hypothetical protein